MENLDDIFREALQYFVDSSGKSQRKFATEDLCVQPSFLNDLLKQRKYGNEATRRKIADALGYPGSRYEEFLDIGRRKLGLIPESETAPSPVPNTASGDEEDWKGKYLSTLEEHSGTMKILMAAQLRIAELERQAAEMDAINERLKQNCAPDSRLRSGDGLGLKELRKKVD